MATVTALPPALDRAARADVREFQSDTAELLAEKPPISARITLHFIAATLGAAILMASIFPVDRMVQARGRVVSQAPTIVVQPLETAIVRRIAVREGQVVRAGQLIAALDPTFSTADLSRLDQQVAALAEEIARLSAELDGAPYQPTRDGLQVAAQRALYASRQAEYQAQVARYDERIAAVEAGIARAMRDRDFYTERLGIYEEVEGMRQTLEKKKAGSRLNALVATDSRVEMERNVVTNEGTIRASRHELEALKNERIVFEKQWRARIAQDLSDRQLAFDQAREELAKATRRFSLVELTAVEDAIVQQMGAVSVGSVVQSGEKIATLVPLDTVFEVEVELAARDQGFVAAGDEVVLKFDAWPFVEHGSARGRVRSISPDAYTPQPGTAGSPYYLAVVEITDLSLKRVPEGFRLVPGMPLTADIVVGSNTIMAYMLNGALSNLNEGMSEP
ncbi:HlyD family type I secretion periplasmic adaptor subunit [Mongoliimonas terrestris]|uniref:HlyD family type I secretion periplasmic adaptor subunit n=1 Tax=Mongoliimonas terrestris TaxID=1709001 RepID=UPI0009499ADE|nr:HlyD family type I secretion periplasmic adaptor subunit [Mongoliimonas terrestris]